MKLYTVTIGIVAYNEENNIQKLLASIATQKEIGFIIKKIQIILDGCSDATEKSVKAIQDKRIQLINHKKRVGKSQRLNELFASITTDCLILFDADVVLSNTVTCLELVKRLQKNKQLGLVSGNAIAKLTGTFLERAINTSIEPYKQFALSLHNGENIYSCKGAILAVSKAFATHLSIPANVFANDAYLYFACLQNNYHYAYVTTAKIFYTLPNTIQDHIKQNTRFMAAGDNLVAYFGSIVTKEFAEGKQQLKWLLLKQAVKYPMESGFIFMLNAYCRIAMKRNTKSTKPAWAIARSTKKGLTR